MARVVLRQKAINDLNDIWRYTFDKWSEHQADKYYARLKLDCMQLVKVLNLEKVIMGLSLIY